MKDNAIIGAIFMIIFVIGFGIAVTVKLMYGVREFGVMISAIIALVLGVYFLKKENT